MSLSGSISIPECVSRCEHVAFSFYNDRNEKVFSNLLSPFANATCLVVVSLIKAPVVETFVSVTSEID